MGGDRCRIEPVSCEVTKSNDKVWRILMEGCVTPYIEKLHRFDSHISNAFVSSCKDRFLRVYGMVEFDITKDLAGRITGLPTDGRKKIRDKNASNVTMKLFFKDNERDRLVKVAYGRYDRNLI